MLHCLTIYAQTRRNLSQSCTVDQIHFDDGISNDPFCSVLSSFQNTKSQLEGQSSLFSNIDLSDPFPELELCNDDFRPPISISPDCQEALPLPSRHTIHQYFL